MWTFFGDAAPNCPKSTVTFIHETTQSSINSSESVNAEIKSLAQNPYGICGVISWSELPVLKSLYCPRGSACSAGRSSQLSGSSWFGGCKDSCWTLLLSFSTCLSPTDRSDTSWNRNKSRRICHQLGRKHEMTAFFPSEQKHLDSLMPLMSLLLFKCAVQNISVLQKGCSGSSGTSDSFDKQGQQGRWTSVKGAFRI